MRTKASLILFFTLFYVSLNAQNSFNKSYTNTPIEKILIDLESHFSIYFSYDPSILLNVNIDLTVNEFRLLPIVREIENSTELKFKKIAAQNFIVQRESTSSNIYGYLKNYESELAIADALVLSDEENFTYSDQQGYFELWNLSPKDTITISCSFIEPKKFNVATFYDSSKKEISIHTNIQSLSAVLISGFLSGNFSKNKDGSLVIHKKKWEVLPGTIQPDVLRSLQFLPGMQNPGDTNTGMYFRGGTPDQNLVLYDGIKMYYYDHFFGMISAFNPYVTDQAIVYRESTNSTYRNNVGAVIDIKPENNSKNKLSAGAGVDMIMADFYIKAPISKKISVLGSMRRSHSDIFKETITFDEYEDHVFQNTKIKDDDRVLSDKLSGTKNDYHFFDSYIKILAQLNEKSKFSFSGLYSKNDLNFLSQFKEINRNTNDNLSINNKGLSLKYESQVNEKFNLQANLNFSDYNFMYDGKEILSDIFDYRTIKENNIEDWETNLKTTYNINNNHKILNGYNFVWNRTYYNIGNISDVIFDENFVLESQRSKAITHNLYTQYYYQKNKLSFSLGARASYYQKNKKLYLQPNASVQYSINEHWQIAGAVSKKNQFLSQIIEFETQNFGLENQIWVLSGEDNIPVLETKQSSLNVTYKGKDWFIDMSTYLSTTNGISSLTKGFNREFNEFSTGKSFTKGIEFLVKKSFNNYSTSMAYNLSKSEYKFQNLNGNNYFDSNYDIRHNLNIIQSLELNHFSFSLGWLYKSPRPYTPSKGVIGEDVEEIQLDYGKINSKRLDDFYRFDFSFMYRFKPFKNKNIKGKLGFSVLNLLNQSSIISKRYRLILDVDSASYKQQEINKYSIGRTPNFSIHFDF